LKIYDAPGEEVYVTFVAEILTGLGYALSAIREAMLEVASRDERRVVIFNFGFHDLKEGCVEFPADLMGGSRSSGDCIEFFRSAFHQFLDFLDSFPAELKIFRTCNAGWMRWGQFGFGWPASNDQVAIYSHHSVRTLNDVAIQAIRERQNNTKSLSVKVLDYYWPTLARPDNTAVDGIENRPGSHIVHPGIDTTRLLVQMQVTMILRHFCSDFLDEMPR